MAKRRLVIALSLEKKGADRSDARLIMNALLLPDQTFYRFSGGWACEVTVVARLDETRKPKIDHLLRG